MCNLTPEVRDILKILWKRGEIASSEQFLLFSTIFCYLLLGFRIKTWTRFLHRDKRLFEIGEVEKTITKTRLYSFDPLKLHFYIVKLVFTDVYINVLFRLKNIHCGYSLEPPRRGGSNQYPQSMF